MGALVKVKGAKVWLRIGKEKLLASHYWRKGQNLGARTGKRLILGPGKGPNIPAIKGNSKVVAPNFQTFIGLGGVKEGNWPGGRKFYLAIKLGKVPRWKALIFPNLLPGNLGGSLALGGSNSLGIFPGAHLGLNLRNLRGSNKSGGFYPFRKFGLCARNLGTRVFYYKKGGFLREVRLIESHLVGPLIYSAVYKGLPNRIFKIKAG